MISAAIPIPMADQLLRAALAYAARGLPVFPCRPLAKTPLTEHGFKDASTDPAVIAEWWRRAPDANIAIVTGKPSGWLVVDVDPRNGGEAGLRLLVDDAGPLPQTLQQRTPRGGRHLIFKAPQAVVVSCRIGLRPGVDIKANGGYVMVAPSRTEAGAYLWAEHREPTDAPDRLIALLTRPASAETKATPPGDLAKLALDGASEGARNDAVARIAGHLLRHHVNPHLALAMIQGWNATRCQPPLAVEEVEQTVESIAAKELRRRGLA